MNKNKWFLNGGRGSGRAIRLLCETYENKIASGNFSIEECMAFSRYFNKPVDYLFMKESDIPSLDTPSPVNSITN